MEKSIPRTMAEKLKKNRQQNTNYSFFYKIANMLTPLYLAKVLSCMRRDLSQFSLRFDGNFSLLRCRITKCYVSYIPSAVKLWNDLSVDIRSPQSLIIFKLNLR